MQEIIKIFYFITTYFYTCKMSERVI